MKKTNTPHLSLSEVHGTIDTSGKMGFRKRLLAFLGPAYLVSVGYMDPGNWATDIAGGSQFGYRLIWVLMMSNLIALLLQSLSARLGIVRGKDLAQASREIYPRAVNLYLYILAEIAIAACDLAEVLGMAIGLQLLFHIPLFYGVMICALDTILLLFLLHYGIRKLEAFVISLILMIGGAFVVQMFLAHPSAPDILSGFIPSLPNSSALYIAIGIIGATVMPHNLYLHSALVQTRKIDRQPKEIRRAIKFNNLDSFIALNLAFFVNAAILILAASTFYKHGLFQVASIMEAQHLLEPLMGSHIAPVLFAVALLCAGQSSTITGTLAGQIVMEGYLDLRIAPWLRRLITRLIAITPALLTIRFLGNESITNLLILSQVILSLQLGFAVIPLIHFVSDKTKMGEFVIPFFVQLLAWICALIIILLNVKMITDQVAEWLSVPGSHLVLEYIVIPIILLSGIVLLYITLLPFFKQKLNSAVSPIPHGTFKQVETLRPEIYKRVAITIDFSAVDEKVIRHALTLGGSNAHFLLIHVTETAGALFLGQDTLDLESRIDMENLLRYMENITSLNFKCTIKSGYGSPRKILPKLIKEFNADLIVMGAHGHKGLKDFMLGSTIDAVRHNVNVPVLVVR